MGPTPCRLRICTASCAPTKSACPVARRVGPPATRRLGSPAVFSRPSQPPICCISLFASSPESGPIWFFSHRRGESESNSPKPSRRTRHESTLWSSGKALPISASSHATASPTRGVPRLKSGHSPEAKHEYSPAWAILWNATGWRPCCTSSVARRRLVVTLPLPRPEHEGDAERPADGVRTPHLGSPSLENIADAVLGQSRRARNARGGATDERALDGRAIGNLGVGRCPHV